MAVRQQSKHELVTAVQARYARAGRAEKGRILDEFVAATGYHRKWAIGLLRHGPPPARSGRGGRPRAYSAVVVGALRTVWEASGELCGKRLAPFLPELVPALEAEGVLTLEAAVRAGLLTMSAATIDRRLHPFRLQRHGLGTSTAGHYLNTLTVTDVATAWTECVGVWGKGQAAVFRGLEHVRERLPFPLLGIDSDNGTEFLNAHLVRWCAAEQVTFTRSRPYWKNDQAHVEQKNWSVVRRLLGYDRYETEAELAQLHRVYRWLRLWTNHWQPVLKLIGKEREGAKVRKRYDTAQTPYRRVLASGELLPAARERLAAEHAAYGPTAIWQEVASARTALWRLGTRPGLAEARAGACG
jgi:hypothetical protein